jgi:tetratricopeptide (TPR) repeat protein
VRTRFSLASGVRFSNVRHRIQSAMKAVACLKPFLLASMICLCSFGPGAVRAGAADETAVPAAVETNATLLASNELRLALQAIEELRRELEASAARGTQAMTVAIGTLESALVRQHERELETLRQSNKNTLTTAAIFGAVAFITLMGIALILMRTVGRVSDVVALAVARGPALGGGAGGAFTAGELAGGGASAVEQASARFIGAVEQLHKRMQELEQSVLLRTPQPAAGAALPEGTARAAGANIHAFPQAEPAPALSPAEAASASEAHLLLGKGQALLNLDDAAEALACFDQAVALDPGNAEAHVKRGMALEKLQNWEQAAESYDRAIALNNSLTVAYLYKGGVCNRLQRFREALDCYEQALRTEKKTQAS